MVVTVCLRSTVLHPTHATMPARILVARVVPPRVLERLRRHFDVEANADDVIYTPAELV